MAHVDQVKGLIGGLNKDNMKRDLEKFTSFHTRYYKSNSGIESATWLYNKVQRAIHESGADGWGATVNKFDHPWGQFSVIARIPGISNKTVVLGAHQDSINLFLPSILSAPGADDDGSGTVTILEALRGLLKSEPIARGQAPNTIEFHWYSAEEGGMLGSQAIFSKYKKYQADIKAMLQQDMTGYTDGSKTSGHNEEIGVMTDYVDPALTAFIKNTISTVSCHSEYFGPLTYDNSTVPLTLPIQNADMLALTTRQQVNMDTRQLWRQNREWKTATSTSTPPATRLVV